MNARSKSPSFMLNKFANKEQYFITAKALGLTKMTSTTYTFPNRNSY